MAWDEAERTSKPIVEAILKFDESSASLSREMIALSRRIYWLTWVIATLTFIVMFLTVWLVFVAKPVFNEVFQVQEAQQATLTSTITMDAPDGQNCRLPMNLSLCFPLLTSNPLCNWSIK